MFRNTTFFLMIKADGIEFEVKRLNLTRDSQTALCRLFSESANGMLDPNNEYIQFDGSYKPDGGEIQYINEYVISESIVAALREPTSIDPFVPDSENLPEIKGIFTGVIEPEVIVALQKFNKSQYIARKGISLLHNQNTFERISSFGISVEDNIDCVYKENKLFFKSFLNARQAFNLSDYYRLATDTDINNFVCHANVNISDQGSFRENADSWVRRKIALIFDSGTLDEYTPAQIAEKALEYNLTIQIQENQGTQKINLPSDKREMKNVLKFLDEDIYKGPFSNMTYETNSKRKLNS